MMYIFWALVAVLIVLKLLGSIALSWWWIVLLSCVPFIFILGGIVIAFCVAYMAGR